MAASQRISRSCSARPVIPSTRAATPTSWVSIVRTFDHDRTDFPLRGGHVGRDCAACHAQGKPFREAPVECVACHGDAQPHMKRLGEKCAGCHSEDRAWPDVRFDHSKTAFDLTRRARRRRLQEVAMSMKYGKVWRRRACRAIAPTTCTAAVAARTARRATTRRNGAASRSTISNRPVLRWSADTTNSSAARATSTTWRSSKPPKTCIGCHSADDHHHGRFGSNCAHCHGESTWKNEFDHLAKTGFALKGAHETVALRRLSSRRIDRRIAEDVYRLSRERRSAQRPLSRVRELSIPKSRGIRLRSTTRSRSFR